MLGSGLEEVRVRRTSQPSPVESEEHASGGASPGVRTRSDAAYGGSAAGVQLKPAAGGIAPLAHGPAAGGADPFWFAGGSSVQLKPETTGATDAADAGPELPPHITAERPAWKGADLKPIQKELIRLGLYRLGADGIMGRGTETGLVEAFGGDEWRTLSPAECLDRLKAAKPSAAGKKGEHSLRYGEMFKDGIIDMTLALGFDEAGFNQAGLDNLTAALEGHAFARDVATATTLYQHAGRKLEPASMGEYWVKQNALTYKPPAGPARPIHGVVRLVYSLDGSRGGEVAKAYKEGLAESDVAYYSGHGRYGSGPDFDRNYTFKLFAEDGSLEQTINDYEKLEHLLAAEGKKHGRSAWKQFEWSVEHKRLEVDASNDGNVVLNDKNAHPGEFGANLMYWAVNQKGGKGAPKVTGKGGELDQNQAKAAEPERKYRVVVFDGCRSVDYNKSIRATPGYDEKSADMFGSTKSLNWGDEGKTLAAFLDSLLHMQSAEQVAKNMDDQQSVGPNSYHAYGADENPVVK
jgi:hypothetical protein